MSFAVNAQRVMRYGLSGFVRNGFVSLAAVAIMTITLAIVAFFIIFGAALSSVLHDLTNKVDITVYFTPAATEEQVLSTKSAVEALPEVVSVEEVSAEQALAIFRERHKNDQLTLGALDQLGENPLGASLEVRARETSQYESIARFLEARREADGAASPIEKVNFFQNKGAIDRLSRFIEASRSIALVAMLILGAATVLITFNTIRLAIYTARDEIGVMNIVGAGAWYVRGPFIVTGILYGVIAGIIVILALYPITLSLGEASERFFVTFNVFEYFVRELPTLALIVFGCGIALGALSSYLAVHRYLRA
jgi:cell division transport system permease protein